MSKHGLREAVGLAVALTGALVMSPLTRGRSVDSPGDIRIAVLSSRPDMVSGGDALVEATLPPKTGVAGAKITVNGRDVSRAFKAGSAGTSLVGLVEGLQLGKNVLHVAVGKASGQIELTNHPIAGPILSGPHLTPLVCTTEKAGLGPALDANCSALTKFEFFYRTKSAEFKPLDPTAAPPADLVETTTREGQRVPYIVRVESGTINRAIYRIAILDDPKRSAQPWAPGLGWNRRLVVVFGGGCGTNYNQGVNAPATVLNEPALSRGFAYMTSTQNVMGQHCNDALSGEALMMIKEHFIERYGVPLWTAGTGGSGGAMQQLLIAQNFPGLLDGIQPSLSFPDHITYFTSASDCRLTLRYFADNPGWTEEQRRAVQGDTPGMCEGHDSTYVQATVATSGCGIPQDLIYHPVRNPKGARCTVWDTNINSYGRDPATGGARRTFDNVGVEYGRQALLKGTIIATQFVDLNSKIGGYDNDGNLRGERTIADPEALRLAYASGRVNSSGGSLSSLPILIYRPYLDLKRNTHDRMRDFQIRERLLRANGRADNSVIWINPDGPLNRPVAVLALDTMSQWLDALQEDKSADSAIVKVVRAKPTLAVDACWDEDGTRIDEPFVLDGPGKCNKLYPTHANPRLAAGSPVAGDILKCQLKPLSRSDYPGVTFTDAEWQQLMSIFSTGVCDYSKPGVHQGRIAGTYQSLPLVKGIGAQH